MGETGIMVRFPGSLDPRAEEFRPTIQWYPLPLPVLPIPPPPPPPPQQQHLSTSSTRSLLLTPVPVTTESALRTELEVFGHVRALQMEALRHGIVTVHFYDLRHAETAFAAIRSMHHYPQFYPAPGLVAGRPVWAHYVLPNSNALPDAHNQGTLVVFNLDPHVSTQILRRLFDPFGPIKELRDTPWKKNQRFVEFFDIRDAAKALKHMNGKEIHGKPLVIEFSRPGGHTRNFFHSPPSSKTTLPPPRRFAAPSSTNKGAMTGELEEPTHPRKILSRKQNCETTVEGSTKHQQQQVARSRHWKGKQAKKHETRFLIKEDAILESAPRDTRTTVMIKNIPNKYSQKLLLNMLDNHCIHCNEQIADGDEQEQPLSSYDFVYLPIDFINKCNVGYGFVNMTSPEATLRLYKAFHLQHWEVFNSRKICQVTYARVQGLEALKEHFKNSKFPCEMEHYLPVVFSPPRDGMELTEPLPIVGKGNKQQQHQAIPNPNPNPNPNDDDVASSKSGGVGDDDTNEVGGGVL